jgi:hypothetical protein
MKRAASVRKAECLALLSLFGVASGPSISAQLSRDINTYALFAYDSLSFKGADGSIGGSIYGGNVGVNGVGTLGVNPRLTMDGGNNAVFVSDGTQVAGDTMRLQSVVSVWTLYANSLVGGAPVIRDGGGTNTFTHATTTEAIIAAANLPTLPSFSPGTLGVTNGTTLTLAPGSYGDVRENDNGILNLQAGTYYLNSLSAGKRVHINAVNGTIVYIASTLTLNSDCTIGATGAVFAARSCGNPQYTIKFDGNTRAYGLFFAPNGNLNLGDDSILDGQGWAKVISGDTGVTVNFVPLPEPPTLMLIALSLGALLMLRSRRGS